MQFHTTRCNVITAYDATICKVACCGSHEKTPLRALGKVFKALVSRVAESYVCVDYWMNR